MRQAKGGKLVHVLLAVLVLTLPAAIRAEQPGIIRIGALYPLTGNIASTGLDCRRGVELAVDIINGKYDRSAARAERGAP